MWDTSDLHLMRVTQKKQQQLETNKQDALEKNDVMSDRGLPWRDLRGALFDALPESWLPLSLPSSS